MTILHTNPSISKDDNNSEELNQDFLEAFADIKLLAETDMDEAARQLLQLVDQYPDSIDAHQIAGEFYQGHKLYRYAYECFKKIVELDTENGDAWYQFGSTLYKLTHYDAALIAVRRAVNLISDNSDFYILLAQVNNKLERIEEAHKAYDIAFAFSPDNIEALFQRANIYASCGQKEEAKTLFEKILEIKPSRVHAFYKLIRMKEFEGSEIETIQKLQGIIEGENLSSEERYIAYFGIAHLYDRIKKYDLAFENYTLGNKESRHAPEKMHDYYDGITENSIAGYSRETFEKLRAAANPSDRPVFIVGMMRSGTTLIEQVLSQHSQITAAGEVLKLAKIADSLIGIKSGAFQYPRDISMLSPEVLGSFAQDYLHFIEHLCPEQSKFVTDKLPFNFFHVGLIKVLFPNAKIIHCKRNPLDTCLSNYMQIFERELRALNGSLEELGHFYKLYQKLMKHWHEILPDQIYDVKYEEFTENPKEQTARLLSYLKLDWEDACLEYHKSSRSVKTASQWQVQQPIYRSSINRWKKYQQHLQPLIEILGSGEN